MKYFMFVLLITSLLQNCNQANSIGQKANTMGEQYCKCMRQRLKKEEFRLALVYCESKLVLESPYMLSHYVELRFWNQTYPLMPNEEKQKADEFWEQFCHYTDCNCYKESRVNYWRNNKLRNGTKR